MDGSPPTTSLYDATCHGSTATPSLRRSRGRSIGEFVFVGTTLHMELFDGGGIVRVVKQDVTRALFITLNAMEIPGLMAPGAWRRHPRLPISGGTNPPRRLRILWGIGPGGLTAVLLLLGGVETLQAAAIMAALPFSVVIWMMVIAFNRALHDAPQSPHRGKRCRISRDPLTE